MTSQTSGGRSGDSPGGPSLVVVSGLSGAGRTTAIKALEDLGYFCVDNLPVVLLEPFVELFPSDRKLAVVIDVREKEFLEAFPRTHDRVRERGLRTDLLFLEAADDVLALRYDETRRVHPARSGGALRDSIATEREILQPLCDRADAVLDTSAMSVHELRRLVTRRYAQADGAPPLEVEVVSFGFRRGLPEVADLVIDVRFLPNPHFEPELRPRTGQDPEVAAYVLDNPTAKGFLERYFAFLDYLLPLYVEEGKAYLTLAVGCTGGQHRSVAIAQALERYLRERNIDVTLTHRDVEQAWRAST